MEINKLKKGTFSVEEHARSGLGMIKEGEVFYRTVEKKNNEGMKE